MKKLILICFCFVCVPLFAQENKYILDVRKEYSEIKEEISRRSLYCDYRETNKYRGSWPGSGIYSVRSWTYYSLDGEDCSYGGPCPDLRFVEEKTEVAAAYVNEEWLFKNGNLVFVYIKDAYNDEIEQRAYLKDGKLILYTENNETASPPDNYIERLLEQAEIKQQELEAYFNRELI